jgi:hypothetical protein
MLNYFLSTIPWDKDLSQRARMIDIYTRVYDGTLYDHLKYFYFQERQNGVNGNYIPLHLRQPSVKTNFCKLVADNSVSLLFGSDHFPRIASEDIKLRDDLEDIITYYKVNKTMARAATIGSTGSVVIFVRVLEGALRLEPKNTKYFTPVFDKINPDKLIKLTERYKVLGSALIEQGYKNIKSPNKKYWFHREWNEASEITYLPYLCDDDDAKLIVDKDNSADHNHGFVPALWIRNLERIIDADQCGVIVDGACTFAPAIDTNIEIDYQLSQLGRALKYSADPLLVLKIEDDLSLQNNMVSTTMDAGSGALGGLMPGVHPGTSVGGASRGIARSASNALILNPEDEAKLLEISGGACTAVLEYARSLREYLLEVLQGNRSNADKVNAAQSGKAMQAMNQPLIWLADQLRVSYGECGLLEVLKMIIAITNQPGYGILVNGKLISHLNSKEKITLDWPAWYPDTAAEKVQNANALKTLKDGGFISSETATKDIADNYSIEDIEAERQRIDEDQAKIAALMPKVTQTQNI